MSQYRYALDIETSGLDFHHDELLLLVVSSGDETHLIDLRRPAYLFGAHFLLEHVPLETVAYLLYDRAQRDQEIARWLREEIYPQGVILHNAAFDLPWLDARLGVGFPPRVWDTQVCEQMLTAGLERDDGKPQFGDHTSRIPLASLVSQYLGQEMDKTLQTSFIGWRGEFTEEQLAYARLDAEVLFPIMHAQAKLVTQHNLEQVWEIEAHACPVFCRMEREGVYLDVEILRPLIQKAEMKIAALERRLEESLTYYANELKIAKIDSQQHILDEYLARLERETERLEGEWREMLRIFNPEKPPQGWEEDWFDTGIDKKDQKPKGMKRYVRHHLKKWRQENKRPPKPAELVEEPINLNSHQQLTYALSALLGREVTSTKSHILSRLLTEAETEEQRQVLEDLIAYKKEAKLVQAFGESLISKRCPCGKIHSDFSQYGTATGRPTACNPNILQTPADENIRAAFRASPGNVMIVADFSQMELRIAAELSGDRGMIEIFQRGDDTHSATARDVFNVEQESADQRRMAKTLNFLMLYGGGAKTFQENLAEGGMHLSLAECKQIVDSYSAARSQLTRYIRRCQKQGVAQGFIATPLGRKRFFDKNSGEFVSRLERQAGNAPIQGANADVTKLAMAVAQPLLDEIGGYIVLQVYDELVAEVPEEHAERGAAIVTQAMVEAARTVLRTVPVQVDCVISKSWSEKDVVAPKRVAA